MAVRNMAGLAQWLRTWCGSQGGHKPLAAPLGGGFQVHVEHLRHVAALRAAAGGQQRQQLHLGAPDTC